LGVMYCRARTSGIHRGDESSHARSLL
jgi:hypothetical protein